MEYKVESTELTDIADAIREKSGSQDALTFPDEFVSGIRGIPTGSTSIVADEYDDQSTYDVGDYVVYENALYKCNTAITTAEEWTSAHWDEVTVMEEVETKADTDGMYEDMSVGNLISTQFVENKEPYLFRRTGNGKNIGGSEKAFIDKIIGGTVAWNQLVQKEANKWSAFDSTATITLVDDVLEIHASTSAVNVAQYYRSASDFVAGHKYLSCGDVRSSVAGLLCSNYQGSPFGGVTTSTNWTHKDKIIAPSSSGTAFTGISIGSGADTVTIYIRNMMVIDLTALSGSAEIADYVYSLEQTTAGAGVEWLKSHGFIDGSYRAFDSGSLQSVKTSEHRTVGKNLMHLTLAELKSVNTPFTWNDNVATLNGLTYTVNIDANGLVESIKVNGTASANTVFRFNNYFSLPKGNYVLSGGTNTHNNDFNITNMKTGDVWNGSTASTGSLSLTVNENDTIRQYLYIKSGYAVSNVMLYPMIRFSDISDATYEPYESHSYPLDSDLELRGIPKLSNGSLYYDGDVYESSGNVSRKYGIVDLGTLDWTVEYGMFHTTSVPVGIKLNMGYSPSGICSKYLVLPWNESGTHLQFANDGLVWVKDPDYTDAATFKSAMSGVYLVYELATPTTEQADPYANQQIVSPLGTEEYVDTRDVPVPVGHETKYMANLREKIEDLPWDLSMIAPIENGTTASKAYSTGQYFLKDNQFCKALTSIASGATFTLNTNYAVTTVANELYTALHS